MSKKSYKLRERVPKMQILSDMKDCVRGIKNLKLNSPQAQTLETPGKSRAAQAVNVAFPAHANTSKMSLPGLDLSAPDETIVTPTVHELKEKTEWRFEVAFGTKVEVRLLSGSAELFGTELPIKQAYTFTGTKAAIYTWHGCRIEVVGDCQVDYIAEETPMVVYANLHFALENLRDNAHSEGRDGPRVLVVGSENAGKTSLVKILTAYTTKLGRQPVVVNLDTKEGMLTIPGTLSATTFTSVMDVENGWGSSPMNGPSQVPVKLPLVYHMGLVNPEEKPLFYKPVVTRLALSVMNRLQDDGEAKDTGVIIDTPGVISQGKSGYEMIQHIVSEFLVNVVVVLGSERLYSDLLRRFNAQNTGAGETIAVVKVDKSGGCVDRDEAYLQQFRQSQIREYFFGDANTTLSPHTQQVDFNQLSIYRSAEPIDDLLKSLMPGDETDVSKSTIFDKVRPSPQMQNAILTIVNAHPEDTQENIRDASVMGFMYVADVDEKKSKLKVLAPVGGRLPNKAVIWGSWPEGISDLIFIRSRFLPSFRVSSALPGHAAAVMSGAEAIVAFGVATNVVQFIDFTAKLCGRIREYASGSSLPKKLAPQADRLSDLLGILESLNKSSNHAALSGQALARCQTQAQELSDFLDDLKSDGQRQNWAKNARRAFRSLNRSDQIEELQDVLDSLVGILSLQLQADTRSVSSRVQENTVSILERQLEQTSLLSDLRQMAGLKDQINGNASLVDKVVWIVSIGRNPDFIGRTAVMSALESKLAAKPDAVPTAVLCGLGGVGKSQIALEYAYRVRGRSTNISVLWVHAGNTARFVESYKRIASELQISGRDDPNVDVLQLVRDWLETKYECRWLMIFDNVDDRKSFFESYTYAGKALREYVPQNPQGSIIYTTRNVDIGMDLALDRIPVTVPPMDVYEAQALLGERIRAESTETEQLELLEDLVYLPLAISQATAFMAKRHKSVAQYVKLYRGSESTRIRLLGQRFNYHGREARPLESVVTTWWVSFNYIKTENPRSAELLSMMSFMDQQDIPFSLLIADEEDTFDLEEAMGLLEAFSLITLDTHRYSCNVHRLVTVAVQAWLSEYENKREMIAAQVLELVSDRFPNGFFESWPICRIYFPHAEEVLRSSAAVIRAGSLHAKAYLLLNLSTFLRTQGRYEASELRARESMQFFERLYGSEHSDTLCAIASYAKTLHKLGRWQEAMLLQRQILKSREKVLGISHRATLESLNTLGFSLKTLGQYREAEEIHRKELIEKQKILKEQPEDIGMQVDVLTAMGAVADVLDNQRKFVEAEHLLREALSKTELVLGRLHPDVFITRGQLAGTVRDQGRLDEAEQMYNALLRDRLELLGDHHPDTLVTLSNLATVFARQGNQQKSEGLYREVLRIEQETLGARHPSTINTMHNLACSVFDRQDYRQAATEFKAVLALQKQGLGPTHPQTMQTRRNFAVALRNCGDHEQGNKLDYETLELCSLLDENKELEQILTLENLAKGLRDQEKYSEAESIRRQELELRLASGEDEKAIQENLYNIAFVLSRQAKYDEAEPIYNQILSYRSLRQGPEHEETLQILWNLALTYLERSDFVNAEAKYLQIIGTQTRKLGKDHPNTLDSLLQLAWVLQQQQKYAQAEERYRFLLEARSKSLGSEHQVTLMIMNNLASVLKYQDNVSEEATPLLRHVHETRLKTLGPEDDLTKKSTRFLQEHLRDSGKHEEAEILDRQSTERGSDCRAPL